VNNKLLDITAIVASITLGKQHSQSNQPSWLGGVVCLPHTLWTQVWQPQSVSIDYTWNNDSPELFHTDCDLHLETWEGLMSKLSLTQSCEAITQG